MTIQTDIRYWTHIEEIFKELYLKKLTKRDQQTIRFLKWTKKYPGWWYLICTPNDEHMNPEMMRMLIKHLAKEQLYEMIFVLLMVHRKEQYVKDISSLISFDLIIKNWGGKRKDREQIVKGFLSYFE